MSPVAELGAMAKFLFLDGGSTWTAIPVPPPKRLLEEISGNYFELVPGTEGEPTYQEIPGGTLGEGATVEAAQEGSDDGGPTNGNRSD